MPEMVLRQMAKNDQLRQVFAAAKGWLTCERPAWDYVP
jgi:hypothetical protein